jgi:hypothetical protein
MCEDAFSLPSWKLGVPYIFPPTQLIGRVLQRLIQEGVEAIVVVPKWPDQSWWGMFVPNARMVVELGKEKEVLIPGPLMCRSPSEKKLPPGMYLMARFSPGSSEGI